MEATQGHARINGGIVLYLKAPPQNLTDLKNELTVLQSFLAAWNANTADTPAEAKKAGAKVQHPFDTHAYPNATRILVTTSIHPSDQSSKEQDQHISVLLATEANWALKTNDAGDQYHEQGASVHIFCHDEDLAQGYKDFWIHQARRRNMNGAGLKQEIANAEARSLGTLGQGNLA